MCHTTMASTYDMITALMNIPPCVYLHKTYIRLGPSTFHHGKGQDLWDPILPGETIVSYWVAGVATDNFSCNLPPTCMQVTLIKLNGSQNKKT